MKILFIVLSLSAFTYLIAQTQFVQAMLANSLSSTATTEGNEQAISSSTLPTDVAQITAQLAKINAENVNLNDKVRNLEAKLANLSTQISANTSMQSKFNTNSESVDVKNQQGVQTLPVNTIEQVAVEQSLNRISDAKFTVPSTEVSEQQKRLKQQAILREVVKKMELSALRNIAS